MDEQNKDTFIEIENSVFKKRIYDFYNLDELLYELVQISSDNIVVKHIPTGKLVNFRY